MVDKEFKIKLTAEKNTDAIKDTSKDLWELFLVLRMINLPFRLYYTGLKISHAMHATLTPAIVASAGATQGEAAAQGELAIAVKAANAALKEQIVLLGALTGGAAVPFMAAGAAAAAGVVAGAGATPYIAQTMPGEAHTITKTGLAIVHEGEEVGRTGGGGVSIHIGQVTLAQEGMSIGDFTGRLGSEVQLQLRGMNRSLPV